MQSLYCLCCRTVQSFCFSDSLSLGRFLLLMYLFLVMIAEVASVSLAILTQLACVVRYASFQNFYIQFICQQVGADTISVFSMSIDVFDVGVILARGGRDPKLGKFLAKIKILKTGNSLKMKFFGAGRIFGKFFQRVRVSGGIGSFVRFYNLREFINNLIFRSFYSDQ